jgi:hypothetical protein
MKLTLAARLAMAKCIRLLASDRDGEALAAVRALGRALKANGADFHAFAQEFVETSSTAAPSTAPPAPPAQRRRPAGVSRDDRFSDGSPISWSVIVGACASKLASALFTAEEREFIASMEGWCGEPTEQQAARLSTLFKRVWRAA